MLYVNQMTNAILNEIYTMKSRDSPLSHSNSSSVHFSNCESDIQMILSFVKTDVYRMSLCGHTGNAKVNKTVSVGKDVTVHCWSHRRKETLAPRAQEIERLDLPKFIKATQRR